MRHNEQSRKNGKVNFKNNINANTFKNFSETLAYNFVLKLPKAPNIFTLAKTLTDNRLGISRNNFNLTYMLRMAKSPTLRKCGTWAQTG